MKTLIAILILFVLPLSGLLYAQESSSDQQTSSTPPAGDETQSADVNIDGSAGAWGSDVREDSSKAEEYGEVPEGFLVDHVTVSALMKDDRFLHLRAENIALNDGQYAFDYGVLGHYQLNIDYSKIPHLFSKTGETIWTETSPGVWTLPDVVQRSIQNLNPNDVNSSDPAYQAGLTQQRAYISNLLLDAHPQGLGLQRNRGTVGFEFSPSLSWKYGVQYFRENRDGLRPFGTTLGFSWAQELPEHIDYNTDRVRAGIEYAANGRFLSAAYEYMSFQNSVESMIWDNPLRIDDRALSTAGDGTSRGRVQLPSDNHSNKFQVSGGGRLGSGRISGTFALASWRDEVNLLPFTINSSLEQVPLPSSTFNGDLRNITADLRYYVAIGKHGNLTANYRLYDQTNNNDHFLFTEFSPLDATINEREAFDCDVAAGTCTDVAPFNHLFAHSTNTFDLDFNYAAGRSMRWLVGYTYNRWNREERDADTTSTNAFRLGLDSTMGDRLTLHARYQYDHRTSDSFFTNSPTFLVIPLTRFDVADLNRNYFRLTADYAIGESSSLGFFAQFQKDDYPDTIYGLQDWNTYHFGVDYSRAITSRSTLNAWYEYTTATRDQNGRQSSSSTPSTTTAFDWTANLNDKFNTFGIGFSVTPKDKWKWDTDAIVAIADGSADFGAGAAIRPTGAVDLTNVDDTNHYQFRTEVSFKAFSRTQIGVSYWFDKYTIDDYAENNIQTDQITVTVPGPTGPTTSTPGVILLNATQRDYLYHTGWIGFIISL